MKQRSEDQEGSVAGQGIYDVILDIAKTENLGKTKGRQKLIDAIKIGTDMCQKVKCDTTAEMSLMIGDERRIVCDVCQMWGNYTVIFL